MKRFDTLVIGSGIAGLFTALRASEVGSVALVTKSSLEESNTRYAQGGIAAVMFDDDSADLHALDTTAAGAGLCDDDAVRILCTEGPDRIRDLLAVGVAFDSHNGKLARGLEAAHSRSRVLHAGGDMTGARIESALAAAVRARGISVFENTFLTDLIMTGRVVSGAEFLDAQLKPVAFAASAVVLASGGAGQMYQHTTNPSVATGDGLVAAFRAGAMVADAEFFQFHPTALAFTDSFLVSEAVRGEGAVLRNAKGERFMLNIDERAELAPRDIVARAIADEMARQDGDPVMLDATHLGTEFLASRFPSINAFCIANGVDWSRQLVPVTPAAHYWMGGVHTDTWGHTSLAGLYAVGEVANTGVHGANRLASNSLLEGIVFGDRVVRALRDERASELPDFTGLYAVALPTPPLDRTSVQSLMWNNVGLARDRAGLEVACKQLTTAGVSHFVPSTPAEHETVNLATAALLVARSALQRTESRGAHYRADFRDTQERWRRHNFLIRESA